MRNLTDRARRLCSKDYLPTEIEYLKKLFRENGYPETLISKHILTDVPEQVVKYGPEKRGVCIRLPYLGQVSGRFEREIRDCVQPVYGAVKVVPVYSTYRAFVVRKDALPIPQQSSIIYNYECLQCKSRYIGRTLQHLGARIRQHVPLHLLPSSVQSSRPRRGRPPKRTVQSVSSGDKSTVCEPSDEPGADRVRRSTRQRPTDESSTSQSSTGRDPDDYQSTIAKHLVQNPDCLSKYSDSCFSVVSRGRSKSHLEVLEAVHISLCNPSLCVQKKFVSILKLFPL